MKNPIVVNLTLLLIALIWGAGFVPQKLGMNYVGPAAFNALRFFFGALTLVPVMLIMSSVRRTDIANTSVIKFGALLGSLLFAGALCQQVALLHTSVANVSFITGLYVIVVPVIGFFLGYRYAAIVWLGGIIAIVGLYLMTEGGAGGTLKGDLIALVGAFVWALHIILISERAAHHNQLSLSFFQFIFCAMFSLVVAVFYEGQVLPLELRGYFWPLVNGVIVVGLAYTLQVIVMQYAEPFAASLILSLEAVFGAVAGYLVFSEYKELGALFGAALMLVGCIMAQRPSARHERAVKSEVS